MPCPYPDHSLGDLTRRSSPACPPMSASLLLPSLSRAAPCCNFQAVPALRHSFSSLFYPQHPSRPFWAASHRTRRMTDTSRMMAARDSWLPARFSLAPVCPFGQLISSLFITVMARERHPAMTCQPTARTQESAQAGTGKRRPAGFAARFGLL